MIRRLAWDSEFFGYEVGKAEVNSILELQQWKQELDRFQLVYIYSGTEKTNHLPHNLLHVGTLVKLKKNFDPQTKAGPPPFYSFDLEEGVIDFSKLDSLSNAMRAKKKLLDKTLIGLALKSGKFSRFNIDWRLKSSEYENLYIAWIQNAIKGKERVLVFKDQGIRGFITVSSRKGKARIGLMAVEEEYRGKGIGTRLLQAAGEAVQGDGMGLLEVNTQKANLPAMALYRKNGFQRVGEKVIYHWWKNP